VQGNLRTTVLINCPETRKGTMHMHFRLKPLHG
jgi:hypothetical protein